MKRKLQAALVVSFVIGLAIWLVNKPIQFAAPLSAQGYNALLNPTFLAAGGPQTASLQENSIIAYHKLVWVASGTVSTCQVTVDTSADGSSWTTGGAITVQTCTTSGNSGAATNVAANFIRINASTLSGTGSVTFTYTGFVQNPSSGGVTFPLAAPASTLNSYSFTGSTTTGMGSSGANTLDFSANNVNSLRMDSSGNLTFDGGSSARTLFLDNGFGTHIAAFSRSSSSGGYVISASVGDAGLDAGGSAGNVVLRTLNTNKTVSLQPFSGGFVSVDHTAVNDEGGLFRAGVGPCRINSNITLSTGATTICSWSLPAISKVWYWSCNFDYNVSAGTTPTITINMNSSQAPTTETGSASIYTTTGLVGTQATVTSTSANAVAILTSGTITPGATIDQANTFGVVQASATAGTFLISITGTGASFAGTLNAGSGCTLN